MTISLLHYMIVASLLFGIGVFGVAMNRRNLIVLLMAIELMLLAVNILFIAFSSFWNTNKEIFFAHAVQGRVFVLFTLAIAAAEAAIGLAILVIYFRNRSSVAIDDVRSMKG